MESSVTHSVTKQQPLIVLEATNLAEFCVEVPFKTLLVPVKVSIGLKSG